MNIKVCGWEWRRISPSLDFTTFCVGLYAGSAWIMENLIQVYNEEYTVPPVDVIILAPLQGCALNRICEYHLQYEAALERRIGCRPQSVGRSSVLQKYHTIKQY